MLRKTTMTFAALALALTISQSAGAQVAVAASSTLPSASWLDKLSAAERRQVEARYAALKASVEKHEQTAAALKESIRKSLEASSPKERELFISRLEQRAGAARLNARGATTSRAAADDKLFAADFKAAQGWYDELPDADRKRIDGRYATYSALMLDFHRTTTSFKVKVDGLMKNAPAQEKTLFAGRVRQQLTAE